MLLPKLRLLPSLLVSLSLLATACGRSSDEESQVQVIQGSRPSDGGSIERSTVALANSQGQVFCSGTLIDSSYVVSAAHCLQNFGGRLYIGFGQDRNNFEFIEAAAFRVHPNYTGSFSSDVPSDISLIRLAKSAPAGFSPVRIYKGDLGRGNEVYLAGYGQTESGSSGRLLYTSVNLEDFDADELVVNKRGTGACYGDSGGPAYVLIGGTLSVVGATSRGESGCKGASVYTRVDYFENWLESTTGLNL